MSALTRNSLTPEQDLLCREFYQKIVCDDNHWSALGKTQGVVGGQSHCGRDAR